MVLNYPDELLADFQQFYGLNIWNYNLMADETTSEVLYVAALAYQLPREGRCWAAIDRAGSHSEEAELLRQMEHNQRIWHWANTKEAKNKDTAPQPMQLPGEEEAHERAVEHAERDSVRVAELLGLEIGGQDG